MKSIQEKVKAELKYLVDAEDLTSQGKVEEAQAKIHELYKEFYSGARQVVSFQPQPWRRTASYIRSRILSSKYYKNVKNLITVKELEYLWFRDKAHLMSKPSIDRINNKGHYELSNCRYIEHSLNSSKDYKPPSKTVVEQIRKTVKKDWSLYHKRRPKGKWSVKYDSCIKCGKNDTDCASEGLCRRCYMKDRYLQAKAEMRGKI